MSRRQQDTLPDWGDPDPAPDLDLAGWAFWLFYVAVGALLLHIAMNGGL